jgi:hypothetical protein
MADAANPMNQDIGSEARSPQAAGTTPLTARRPALVTFAAVMMFVLAGFQATWAIIEFSNAAWISGATYGTFGGRLWLWGILDLALVAASIYAGYDILRGGEFGYFYGLIIAGVSAIRWFFYLPAAPALGIVVIAIDVLIIYGLVANTDYFRTRPSG